MILNNGSRFADFFIIGAPKAGTTALDAYLRQHPDIFMCRKEAHYFCSDFPGNINFSSFKDYLDIFDDAKDGQMIGEASVWYLYSEAAVGEILNINPDAKFIVMLRDPVKAAVATHGELLLDLREDEPNFEKAWRLQGDRRKGHKLPLNCREPKQLFYKDVCSWSHQIERLINQVPERNLKVIIMEEFFSDSDKGFNEVLAFLGKEERSLDSYPVINEGKRVKSIFLLKFSRDIPKRFPKLFNVLKVVANSTGLHPGRILNDFVSTKNVVTKSRKAIREEFRRELLGEFKQDVESLERILNRSLGEYWLKG
ncbi:sulfotransferase [Alcanivorax sp. DP30]|uniref:sulfotransferase family protein n=1 Tax=Alcanivorax sp. DP30 TaxID=2606217 RepID=UPI00137005DA|nr:sulfotransferase [Alcanivorax sp. DP30]MZR64165.1 hypothetical protein [Alcanivorax sp. DP30]